MSITIKNLIPKQETDDLNYLVYLLFYKDDLPDKDEYIKDKMALFERNGRSYDYSEINYTKRVNELNKYPRHNRKFIEKGISDDILALYERQCHLEYTRDLYRKLKTYNFSISKFLGDDFECIYDKKKLTYADSDIKENEVLQVYKSKDHIVILNFDIKSNISETSRLADSFDDLNDLLTKSTKIYTNTPEARREIFTRVIDFSSIDKSFRMLKKLTDSREEAKEIYSELFDRKFDKE